MKDLLITGGHGFIGRHVARYFSEKNWHVTAIGHGKWLDSHPEEWGISSWHENDISIASLSEIYLKPDLIVHAAGASSVPISLKNPYEDFKRTVITTSEVLEFMRIYCPHARLVYPSSAGIYGNSKVMPLSESSKPDPVSPYGMHKAIAEQLCHMYSKQYGLCIAIIRLFSIYGPGLRKQLLWDTCEKIINKDFIFYGTGEETRDWLHINDAIQLIEIAFNHASDQCPVVNGGSGKGITVREVLEEILKMTNSKKSPEFTSSQREGDPVNYIANIDIAKSWGWEPSINWRDGVREYVEWYFNGK